MRKFTPVLLLFALLCAAVSSFADLNGTTVTGTLLFQYDTTNYFDPANGYVPSGYGNVGDFTVTVDPNTPTFGFNDGANLNVAKFSGDILTITDTNACCGAGPWTMTFTDASFGTFTKTADNFSNGGLAFDLDSTTQTLTISWLGGDPNEVWNYSATFTNGSLTCGPETACSITPDPSSWILFASGGVLGFFPLSHKLRSFIRRDSGEVRQGEES